MNGFLNQIAFAVRVLRKSPGYALPALAILTLGIGANTAIFGIVNGVLLKPLPFHDSGSIVSVYHVPPPQSFPGVHTFSVSPANYLDWRKQNTVFASMAVMGGRAFRLGGGARPQMIHGILTEPDFFGVLGVQPAIGRAFTADECQPGRDGVIVLSAGFARSHFGAAERAVGQTLELNGRNYHVIGVMPQEFEVKSWFAASREAWAPLAWTPEQAGTRGEHNYKVIARLRPGVTVPQAQAQMNVISERLARNYPEQDKGWGATVISLRDDLVGDVRPALLILLGAVGFVLLIACANTANLVMVRTIARRKEFAIRAALGANAAELLSPVLIETTLLALSGGTLGVLFARSAQSLVVGAFADQMPRSVDIGVDRRVLGFTLVVSIATGIAAGLIASWRLARANTNDMLKSGLGKTDADSGGKVTRNLLVIAEVALSLMLLVGAGLMTRSLWSLYHVDPGFVTSHLMTMSVPIPEAAGARHNRFYEFLARVRQLPGVVSAAAVDNLPLTTGGAQQPIVIEGRPAEVFALQPNVAVRIATPGYLRTMGIPLIAGRDFTPADLDGKKPVVLISRAMARQFWPGENPIGKRLRISFTPEISWEVVGIAGDVKERGLDVLEPVAMLYQPLLQDGTGGVSLVVRCAGGDCNPGPAVARILQEMNPELPLRDVIAMDELLAISLSQHRFSMFLFAALAGLAFLLAAVGIYSVLAYSVRRQVRELGIRMALGAQVTDVIRLVVMEGMKPALIGIACGAFGAWGLSGILSRLIYGVSPTDPVTFVAVAALLATVAVTACLVPAYRATRVDPSSALRSE
ncbi:MAG TPA: ABC transporter permease [Bryobacteraceae bacterium]|jgi:predicted permease|nr:ABC transporter permease [Bryobacteraceae bacterium]